MHAIFVIDTAFFDEPAFSSAQLTTDDAEDWGREQLQDVAERGENLNVEVVTRSCHGTPHEEIIEYADSIDGDLTILGYQGQSHSKSDTIGGVSYSPLWGGLPRCYRYEVRHH